MAQILLPDTLPARLRQTAQQDGLSLPLLFEQMIDILRASDGYLI
ncbi:MAG: hypothetical protein R2932_26480 [Caldilineaceae bacterium]